MEKLTIIQPHSMVTIIEYEAKLNSKLKFLLLTDLHFDHPKCKRDLLKRDLDQAKEDGAFILMNGDIFCLMQGKFDKRGNKGDVLPQYMRPDHFDSIVDDAVEFFAPYASNILFMGIGNHESSLLKRSEFDLLRKFSDEIYHKTKHRIAVGQYHGWIWIKGVCKSGRDRRNWSTLSYIIYHNHGAGGDVAVTGGMIEDHRKMTHVEKADAIWGGHNHNKYARQQAVHYLDTHNQSMKPKIRIVDNIRSGTYKQDYSGAGWSIERGHAPKPLGGIWLTLITRKGKENGPLFIESQVVQTWHEPIEL